VVRYLVFCVCSRPSAPSACLPVSLSLESDVPRLFYHEPIPRPPDYSLLPGKSMDASSPLLPSLLLKGRGKGRKEGSKQATNGRDTSLELACLSLISSHLIRPSSTFTQHTHKPGPSETAYDAKGKDLREEMLGTQKKKPQKKKQNRKTPSKQLALMDEFLRVQTVKTPCHVQMSIHSSHTPSSHIF